MLTIVRNTDLDRSLRVAKKLGCLTWQDRQDCCIPWRIQHSHPTTFLLTSRCSQTHFLTAQHCSSEYLGTKLVWPDCCDSFVRCHSVGCCGEFLDVRVNVRSCSPPQGAYIWYINVEMQKLPKRKSKPLSRKKQEKQRIKASRLGVNG